MKLLIPCLLVVISMGAFSQNKLYFDADGVATSEENAVFPVRLLKKENG